MKNIFYFLLIAAIIWLGVYSIIGMWVFLAMLIVGLFLVGLFYVLLDKE